jgi:hypothetical protein
MSQLEGLRPSSVVRHEDMAISAAISTAPGILGDACSARQVPGECAAGCLTKRSQVLFSFMASLLALPHSGHFLLDPLSPVPISLTGSFVDKRGA